MSIKDIDKQRLANTIPFQIVGFYEEFELGDENYQAKAILCDEYGVYSAAIEAINPNDEDTYRVISIESNMTNEEMN